MRCLLLVIIFSFSFLGKVSSQTNNVESTLRQLFFQLDINAAPKYISNEVETKLQRVFARQTKQDTFRVSDTIISMTADTYPFPSFKLQDLSLIPFHCDSVLLDIQPAVVFQSRPAHATSYRVKPQHLYGHSVSLRFYFSDSIKAESAYRHLTDSLIATLKKPAHSGAFTNQEEIIKGHRTLFEIDRLKKKTNFQRDLAWSINYYPGLVELTLEFRKLTLTREDFKQARARLY